jgi:hypothetical protein
MKSSCKLHLYAIAFASLCHILSFATIILCDLSKATRHYNKSHVIIMTKMNHKSSRIFVNSLLCQNIGNLNPKDARLVSHQKSMMKLNWGKKGESPSNTHKLLSTPKE